MTYILYVGFLNNCLSFPFVEHVLVKLSSFVLMHFKVIHLHGFVLISVFIYPYQL